MSYSNILLGVMLDQVVAPAGALPRGMTVAQALDDCFAHDAELMDGSSTTSLMMTPTYIGIPLIVDSDGWAAVPDLDPSTEAVPLGEDPDALLTEIPWLVAISSDHEEAVYAKWELARNAAKRCWHIELPPISYIGISSSDVSQRNVRQTQVM